MGIIKKGAKAAGRFIAPGAAKVIERYGPKPEEGSRLGLLGKDILRAAFPGVYAITDKFSSGKKKRPVKGSRVAGERQSQVADAVTDLSAQVVDTNTILSSSVEAQAQQNVVLAEILKTLKEGGGAGGVDTSKLKKPSLKGRGGRGKPTVGRNSKGQFTKLKPTLTSRVGQAFRGVGGVVKGAPLLGGAVSAGIEYASSGNTNRALSAGGGAVAGAAIGSAILGTGVGLLTGGIGAVPAAWIGGLLGGWAGEELGKLAYDSFGGKEGKQNNGNDQKLEAENITYKAEDILFKSNSMVIKANELTIKGDLSNLNLGQNKGFLASILPAPHAEDAKDRENAVRDIGNRLRGRDQGGIVQEVQGSVAAIRKMPISPELKQTLQTAGKEAGVSVRVTSGGQPPAPGGPRTGSTRHDNGNAADLDVISGGRVLNDGNPEDVKIKQTFVRAARSAGATGIGAGYMGPEKVHVGFGTPATWGGAPWLASYAEGTRYVPKKGPAIVGEKGQEIVERRGKKLQTPDTASVVNLERGDRVIPAEKPGVIGSFFNELTAPLTGKTTDDSAFISNATREVMQGNVSSETVGTGAARVIKGFSPVGLDNAGNAVRRLSEGNVSGAFEETVRAAPFGGFIADTFNKVTKPPPSPPPQASPPPAPAKRMKKAEADTSQEDQYNSSNMLRSMFGAAA